jgi:hypothetical protein
MKQRIALVAVSALTAGVLSVASAPVANAALQDLAIANCNILNNTANGGAATVGDPIGSNGLIATNCASSPDRLLQKATLFATGTIAVSTAAAATTSNGTTSSEAQRISVSGGTISASAASSAAGTGTITIAADRSRVDVAASTTNTHNNRISALVVPAAGVSTVTITGWNAYTSTASAAWVVTVTIAAASLSGVANVAESTIAFVTADGDASTADVAATNAVTSRTALFLNAQLNDVYGNDVTTGGLVVEVSAGAIVGLASGASGGVVGGLSTSANSTVAISSSVSPADVAIRIQEATAGKGWAGTVKVTWNGIVIGTKSGTILGDIAKITVTPKKIGKNNGATTADAFEYQATDANGTTVPLAHGSLTLNDSSASGIVSATAGTATNSSSAAGKGTITCVSGATGKSSVTMQFILPTGTVIKSNAAEFSCAGAAVAYTASLDKASYTQGEIATLTVKFVDAKGNPANGIDAVTANTNDAVISANQMTLVSAYTNAQTADVNGSATFTLTVGTASGVVDGSYNAIVSFPTLNTVGKNQSVPYKVSSGSTAVSNAQVLQSIVALIASINKQIQALQKLILKR